MIPTWAERCEKFGNKIVTNAMIQQAMQEEIDELRSEMDKMRDGIVSLTDDLFAERRECLKLEKELALQKLSDIGQAIEQEPVAWIKQNIETLEAELHFAKPVKYWASTANNPDIPLYTQPMRELTDKEIADCIDFTNNDETNLYNFARAILAKACN